MAAMRRRRLNVLLALLVIGALLLAARLLGAPRLQPALGFAAKVTCSGVFTGGESVEQVRVGFPDERLRSVVRLGVNEADGIVEATVPLLARRRAVHRPGLGCTLEPVRGRIAAAGRPTGAPAGGGVADTLPWLAGTEPRTPRVALDAARLDAVVDSAFREPGQGPARRTRAIVIVQGGRVVAERYAGGYSAAHRFAGWSMAKSVTSALAGILAGDGVLDLDTDALRPEWQDAGDARGRITLAHLMHMSSGLEFDESYTPTGGATRMLFNSADVAAVAAASPLRHEPGTRWQYSSAATNLISSHIRERFGGDDASYLAFPAHRLFGPVGMRSAVLEPDASGTFVGSSFMYATARDWARFGLLHLQDGMWDGQRILPAGWVAWSVTPAPAAPLGRYGAQWWLNAGAAADTMRRPWPDLPRDIYWASGFQGQYVAVLPSHDLVVVRLGLSETEGAWRLGPFLRSVLDVIAERPGAAAEPAASRAVPVAGHPRQAQR
jgi:CubicO group peptidase (beta-lactamase class C family)